MKKLALVIFLCLLGIILSAKKITVIEEIVNPDSMMIDGTNIYITQGAEVLIFDFKTYALKKKFGKKGQGPQEIPPFPLPMSGIPLMRIIPMQEKLFISTMGKILYFTKTGEFISEVKFPFQKIQNFLNFYPLGSNLVCQMAVQEQKEFFITVSIVDQNYQQQKELIRKKVDLHGGKMDLFSSSIIFEVYKDRIFVVGKDLAIDIFDISGKSMGQAKQPHESIKFNDDLKNKFDDSMKFMFKSYYDGFKKVLYYPDYLPIIFNLQLSDPYLYVFTWSHQGENRELFIFKLDGTFVKKTTIPLKMVQFLIPYPYDIIDKTLYQLVENDDTEEWELLQTPIH
jgi:hypothetical protein